MKRISKIFIFFLIFIINILYVNADEKNLVNIYLFHSNTCPHCKSENTWLIQGNEFLIKEIEVPDPD